MRTRTKILLLVGVLLMPFLVDRVALAVWSWRVHRQFDVLQLELEAPEDKTHVPDVGELLVSPPGPQVHGPVGFTRIGFSTPGQLRPSAVAVGTNGGLYLT